MKMLLKDTKRLSAKVLQTTYLERTILEACETILGLPKHEPGVMSRIFDATLKATIPYSPEGLVCTL